MPRKLILSNCMIDASHRNGHPRGGSVEQNEKRLSENITNSIKMYLLYMMIIEIYDIT